MEQLISIFHIDVKLIIAQLVNFAVVIAVLYYFGIRPLVKLMNERSQKIEKGLKDAEINAEKLEETQEEYKKVVTEAKKEAQEIITKAKNEAEQKHAALMDAAKEKVQAFVESSKQQMRDEKVQMMKNAEREIAALVVGATEKVLGKSVDVKIDSKIIEESIK